jgi:hypothetical protein
LWFAKKAATASAARAMPAALTAMRSRRPARSMSTTATPVKHTCTAITMDAPKFALSMPAACRICPLKNMIAFTPLSSVAVVIINE